MDVLVSEPRLENSGVKDFGFDLREVGALRYLGLEKAVNGL